MFSVHIYLKYVHLLYRYFVRRSGYKRQKVKNIETRFSRPVYNFQEKMKNKTIDIMFEGCSAITNGSEPMPAKKRKR